MARHYKTATAYVAVDLKKNYIITHALSGQINSVLSSQWNSLSIEHQGGCTGAASRSSIRGKKVGSRLLAVEDHPKDVTVPNAVQNCNILGDQRALAT
jgi:hypothetical protein